MPAGYRVGRGRRRGADERGEGGEWGAGGDDDAAQTAAGQEGTRTSEVAVELLDGRLEVRHAAGCACVRE
jgi:hypothetical protein